MLYVFPLVLLKPTFLGVFSPYLEAVSGLGQHLPHWGCALHMESEQVPPPAAAWLSALGMAHWFQNKVAVISAEAGASDVVLPVSKRRNSPPFMQEHPRLGGL